MAKSTKLHDHGVHGREGVSDEEGRNWWPLGVTNGGVDEGGFPDLPWQGHIHPCEVGPLRGKLPPAPDGDPIEMRAAELSASASASAVRFPWLPSKLEESNGWRCHRAGTQPVGAAQLAGWLAREIEKGDAP